MSEFILLAFRIVLFAVFLLAGATKLADPRGSRKAFRDFGLPMALAKPMVLLLPLVELIVAAALLPVSLAWYGAWGALALLGVFLIATGVAMVRGRKPDCHCFGQLHSAPVGWQTVVRNVVLAAAAGWLVSRGPAAPEPDIWAWLVSLNDFERKVAIVAGCVIGFVFFGVVARSRPRPQPAASPVPADAEDEPADAEDEEDEPETETMVETSAQPRRKTSAAPAAPPPPVRITMGIGLPIGASAPDFELPAITGERRSLRSLRDRGSDVLLIFTSPYCHSCEALAPNLVRWSRELQGLPKVVMISRGPARENLAKLKEFAPSWVLLQRDSEVSEAYDVNSTPSAVLVGSDGTIQSELVVGGPEIRKLLSSRAKKKSP